MEADLTEVVPMKGRQRQEGKTRPNIVFRVPDDLLAYIERLERRGLSKTAVVLRALELASEVEAELGVRAWELEMMAEKEGTTAAKVVARLVREGLARAKK